MGRLRGLLVLVVLTSTLLVTPSAQAATPRCRGEVATRVGTAGSDFIRGTDRRDVIVARAGNDVVRGLGGDDVLCGNKGRDRIYGGAGGDRIYGGGADDRMYGGPGTDDLAEHDQGDDLLHAGSGVDWLFAPNGGGRRVVVDLGRGFMRAGFGDDRVEPGTFEVVQGTKNRDIIRGDAQPNELFGGFGYVGDVILGRAGDDVLDVYESSDNVLRGGSGNDILRLPVSRDKSAPDSQLFGGPGRDHLLGRPDDGLDCSEPPIFPGVTVNLMTGDAPDAALFSIEDAEGSNCADTLIGSDAANRLYGAEGDDDIQGMGGDDAVSGDGGVDVPFHYMNGNDYMPPAGNGSDTLDGGDGTDSADGGPGTDECTNFEAQLNCEP